MIKCVYYCIFAITLLLTKCECQSEKDTIKIELVRQKTPREQIFNAPNLSQYGFPSMDWLHKKHNDTNRTTDSIALTRYLDNEFYGKVVIGHPGQTFNMAFDTTWSLSWVLSSRCSSIKTVGCWFHNLYDHTKSSEYKKDNRPFLANEGTFNLTGFYSYDNFSIAHVTSLGQSFVEMVQVPYSFAFNKADGIMGLGPKTDDYDPFFYKLLKQKRIKNPIFSIYLNRDRQSNRGGNVMLGYVDKKHIHKAKVNNRTVYSNITYLPIDALPFWSFDMDKIYLNDKDHHVLCANGCKAFVDASTNTISGPGAEIEALNIAIGARKSFLGKYTVNCDTVNKLPPIDFILGGRNFTLEGEHYIVQMSYKSIVICVSAFAKIAPVAAPNTWSLGGAFLAEFYSIYDVHDKQIGFVKTN